MRLIGFSIFVCVPPIFLRAQTRGDLNAIPSITLPRVKGGITLQELASGGPPPGRASVVKDFVQWTPQEGEPASEETTAYLAYDHDYLYVGYVCKDRQPKQIRGHLTRRDTILSDDLVGVLIDTYYDHRHAYAFSVNSRGIQEDYTVTEPGDPKLGDDISFDTVWYSDARRTPNGYVALIKVPFKSLRFPPQREQKWGIILHRFIARNSETSVWPHVSQKVRSWLVQEGEARGIHDIAPSSNFQVDPYSYFSSTRYFDPQTNRFRRQDFKQRIGMDAKWGLASNLTLDATVNPDFSQIESDEPQITVNRRFEVFFPEKRPFFMENSNFFQAPIHVVTNENAPDPITVLFTRRIADPQYGLKLTGKEGPYTIAALAADDRSPGEIVPPSDPSFGHRAVFDVLHLARDFHEQSSIGVFWSDREFRQSFNRVVGMGGRWQISNLTGVDFEAFKSFSRELDETSKQGEALSVALDRASHSWQSSLQYQQRSPGFELAAGFVPRLDFRSLDGTLIRIFRPEGHWVTTWQPYLTTGILFNYRNVRQDYYGGSGVQIKFAKGTTLSLDYLYRHERFEDIDFLKRRYKVDFSTTRSRWASVEVIYDGGQDINYTPAQGLNPFLGSGNEISLFLTVRPNSRLEIDNTLLEDRFLTLGRSLNVFNNNTFRSKWNYQFTRRLSLRLIGQYSNILPSTELSSLTYNKNFSGDVLLTYLVYPGTALYIGYDNTLGNFDQYELDRAGLSDRLPSSLLSTSAGLFVKFSYLYRF